MSTWLTQTQYDALLAELKERTEQTRPEIARRIEAARQEGDLKENGGYQAAREDQSMNEMRILQLEDLIKNSHVGEMPTDDGIVEPGMVVTAKMFGQEEKFLLGTREAGAELGITVYSPDAPLGKALIGASRGDTVSYSTPKGNKIDVEIIDAVPFSG